MSKINFITCQPMDGNGGDALLPPEGKHAAANLFAMIVESELKGNHRICWLYWFTTVLVMQLFVLLPVNVMIFCLDDIVASASVANDDCDCDNLQASISGKGHEFWCFFLCQCLIFVIIILILQMVKKYP